MNTFSNAYKTVCIHQKPFGDFIGDFAFINFEQRKYLKCYAVIINVLV